MPSLFLSASAADSPPHSEEGDEREAGGKAGGARELLWPAVSEAMQGLEQHLVLLLDCTSMQPRGAALLSRLVGCVANTHVASQVLHAQRGSVSVVLQGWAADRIEADWSDEEPDEFCISSLQ